MRTSLNKYRKTPYKKFGATQRKRKYTRPQTQNARQNTSIARLQRTIKYLAPPLKTDWFEWPPRDMTNVWSALGLASYPVRGDAVNQRIGSDIILKSLEVRYNWSYGDQMNTARMVIVQFTGQNADGSYPTTPTTPTGAVNTIFKPDLLGGLAAAPYNQFFNSQQRSEYRILYDKTFSMGANSVSSGNGHVLITDFPIKKLHFFQDSNDINLPGLTEGLIVMYHCSDSAVMPHPLLQCSFKLNYTDS